MKSDIAGEEPVPKFTGYPVYMTLSEGQRNDINYAIPVLEHINIEGSSVLADCGYDSQKLIDYIDENGGANHPFQKRSEI